MNIVCFMKGHDWKFAYNYGMRLGISMEAAMKMFEDGRTYGVYQCRRCCKQARKSPEGMKILPKHMWCEP